MSSVKSKMFDTVVMHSDSNGQVKNRRTKNDLKIGVEKRGAEKFTHGVNLA